MVSCTIGAITTTPKSFGSFRSSRNSFQTRKRRRCTSDSLSGQTQRGEAEHRGGVDGERGELREERAERRSLEDNPAESDQKISRRNQMRDDLQCARHA